MTYKALLASMGSDHCPLLLKGETSADFYRALGSNLFGQGCWVLWKQYNKRGTSKSIPKMLCSDYICKPSAYGQSPQSLEASKLQQLETKKCNNAINPPRIRKSTGKTDVNI
jgi:hypothetical protein